MELWDLPFMWRPFFPLKMVHWNLGEAETWRKGSEQILILRVPYRQGPFQAFSPGMPMKLLLLALMQPVTQHCQG